MREYLAHLVLLHVLNGGGGSGSFRLSGRGLDNSGGLAGYLVRICHESMKVGDIRLLDGLSGDLLLSNLRSSGLDCGLFLSGLLNNGGSL